ncbi:MAG: TIGR00730 family Rossman fold protein [Bacteroidaceae bacterium]|jgi:uncharacterized protein (TIGR00730 family)
MKEVCVYAASSSEAPEIYYNAAYRTGQLLARCGFGIINGAGKSGLMRALSDGALSEGGQVTGIIPRFMLEKNWQYDALTQIIPTASMHERKHLMAQRSCAAIALPGGYGTLEELAEIITWKQLGLYPHPVVILNTNNFYDPLLHWFRQAVDQQFIRTCHASLWQTATTPEEAVAAVQPDCATSQACTQPNPQQE